MDDDHHPVRDQVMDRSSCGRGADVLARVKESGARETGCIYG
jgi:hypothetical protein